MIQYLVSATQLFECPNDTLFNYFSNPYHLGNALNMPCEVIRQSATTFEYGEGMVKRVKSPGLPAFEETIITYQPQQYIAYRVTRGGIVKNHLGELRFSETQKGSELQYQIRFSPRWPIPLLGPVIKGQLQSTLEKGLAQVAQKLNS
ncbi:MAG: SRPBCC family protein [Aestuariibacter sp.]